MKKILNNSKLSDKEVEIIRDELQAMVRIIFQKWKKEVNYKEQNLLITKK